ASFAVPARLGVPNNPQGRVAVGDSAMNKQFRRFFGRDEEEGQALILFAILMLALLFAVGLAIDAGQLYTAKRTEQEAADAAAFAGAVVIYQSVAPCDPACQSTAIAAARTDGQTPPGPTALHGGGITVTATDGDAAENDQTDSSKFKIDAPYPLDVTGQATGPWFTIPVNSGHAQVGDPFAGFPKPGVCTPPPP